MPPLIDMLPMEGIDILPIEKPEGIEPEGRDPLDPMALEGKDKPLGIEKLPMEEEPVGGSVAAVVVVAVVGPGVVVGSQEAGMLREEPKEKELIGSISRRSTTPAGPAAGFMERPPIMPPILHRPSPEIKNVTLFA